MYIPEHQFTLYGVTVLESGGKYIDFLKLPLLGYFKYRHKLEELRINSSLFTYILNYL